MNVELENEEATGADAVVLPQMESEVSEAVPPDESADQRYGRQLGLLCKDAIDRNEISGFVGAMTWALANIASGYGKGATGDILVRIGKALCFIAEQEQAEREAEEAKQDGAKPH